MQHFPIQNARRELVASGHRDGLCVPCSHSSFVRRWSFGLRRAVNRFDLSCCRACLPGNQNDPSSGHFHDCRASCRCYDVCCRPHRDHCCCSRHARWSDDRLSESPIGATMRTQTWKASGKATACTSERTKNADETYPSRYPSRELGAKLDQVPSATTAIDCCVRNVDKTRKSRPEGRLNSNAKPAATYSPRPNPTKYHRRNWT